MNQQNYYLIDFDSTFIKLEILEEIAKISLRNNPKKKEILQEIVSICNAGMEGTISFHESLSRRLSLLKMNRKDLPQVIEVLKNNITPSILKNKEFFKKNKERVYIISGAFKECILPITSRFGIPESHILANSFVFDKNDNIVGTDPNNPLSYRHGKVKVVKSLGLKGKIIVLGDGYTDYEIKKEGAADIFIAFTENVKRVNIISKADYEVKNFDEFLKLF
ncbi:MAG: HAD-IB family phosphatase [Patescibacteria group bacterium]